MPSTTRLISLLLILLAAVPSATAAKTKHQKPPLMLHPTFHLVSSQAGNVVANARYVFFTTRTNAPDSAGSPTGELGTLIDERTGQQTRLSPAGCPDYFAEIGGPWLMLTCGNTGTEELYDLALMRDP